jgi:hypothetical protein
MRIEPGRSLGLRCDELHESAVLCAGRGLDHIGEDLKVKVKVKAKVKGTGTGTVKVKVKVKVKAKVKVTGTGTVNVKVKVNVRAKVKVKVTVRPSSRVRHTLLGLNVTLRLAGHASWCSSYRWCGWS